MIPADIGGIADFGNYWSVIDSAEVQEIMLCSWETVK
jgi:hypothetical protein